MVRSMDMNQRWSRIVCRGHIPVMATGLAGGDIFDGSANREIVA
ncbi:MAG: hypothetical protein ACP5I8_16920 [Phycisphaerae bacterium]